MELINTYLSKLSKNIFGEPIYRLVWSEDQLEARRGYFGRLFPEIKEVPKYNYIKDRWILEKWFPPCDIEGIDASRGTYEPVWTFEDKDGNPLEPNIRAIQIIIDAANGELPTPTERKDASDKKEEDEVQEMLNLIGE